MSIRRSHKLMAALALASGALVACDLLTGLNADYSANAHDGAAAVGEGGGDGPASDGEEMDGSTTDGPIKADGGVSSYCEARRADSAAEDFFCTDFDTESFPNDGSAPTPWFSLTNKLDAGTFAFVPDAGDGGSRVLDVLGVSTAAGGAHSFLKAVLAKPPEANTYLGYELEFEFRVLASDLDYDAFGLLIFKPNTQVGENGIAGYGGASSPQVLSHQGTGSPPVRTVDNTFPSHWHVAKITLTRVDAGPTYTRTITIDDFSVDDTIGTHTIDPSSPTELWMGIFNADNTPGSAHVQFDNVVLRRTPP